MTTKRSAPGPRKESDEAVKHQLDRILASATFRQVDRLKRFILFIVLEAVGGRGDQLKEYVIGVQVFDKETSFDPRSDPIVRVQARRLRARLTRYYRDEGGADPLLIDLPKGGYAPVFKHREPDVKTRRTLGATFAAQNTIAVLPFSDHSPSSDLAYFCEGIRQEVIHGLAQLDALRVLVSQSVEWSEEADRRESGNAAMIVAGSVRRSVDRLRITIHLIDNASGCYLWSESIDSTSSDLLTVQEVVAQAVAKKLEPRLLDIAHGRHARRPPENLAARNLYLQGRYHLNQRTDEALHKAVDFFEKAIVEDAQFALAHSGLADTYNLLAHYGVLEPAKVWTKAASSAASAVMLDSNSAEAHTSLAHVKATQDWDWSGAAREFQLAITLDPGYATAHHWYAMSCLVPTGRLDEALDEMLLAQSLDPVSSIVARDLSLVHLYRRDFEAALEQCDHTVELNPHFSPAYWALGLIQEQRKDLDESAAAFQRAIHLSPHSPKLHAALGRTLALSGKRSLALGIVRKLEAMARRRYVSPFEFASIRFALNQVDLGFRWLNKAAQDRAFELISLKVDPRFEAVKSDRRLEAIARQMGLS